MRDLVIVGAGGHGRETLDIVEAINVQRPAWNFLGFIDDGQVHADRLERRGAAVVSATTASVPDGAAYVIGIGAPRVRADLDEKLSASGAEAVTLVHPLASIASDTRIGDGVLLAAGARVTTNVSLGRHVHLNVNAVVSHDCVVGDYTSLSPGVHLNGEVRVGQGVFFGTGAIVTPGITVADGATVGAGAVVLGDVPEGATAVGVPARW